MITVNSSYRALLSIIIVMLFISSCSSNTTVIPSTPAIASHTITPSETITPTPTLTPTKSYPEWPITFEETFDDTRRNWIYDTYSGELFTGYFSVFDGRYIVNVTAFEGFILSLSSYTKDVHSIDVSVDADKSFGSYNSSYGLILRHDKNHMYYFEIFEETQQYEFSVLIDEQWKILIKRTGTPFIIPQLVNTIRVMIKGQIFTLMINGKIVNQIEDKTSSSGQVGIGISMERPGDKLLIAFDNFIVREPNA